jgi:hypothetical protein
VAGRHTLQKMSRQLLYGILFVFLTPKLLSAQESAALQIQLDYNQQPLVLGKKYHSKQKDSLQLSTFKCYLSNIKLIYADGSSQVFEKKYNLIDADSIQSHKIKFPQNKSDKAQFIEFSIGVDSISNTQGALANDLDVQNGMYWAWQSGYINWKIEGTSKSCATRKQQFAFHIGGYQAKQNALRTIRLPYSTTSKNVLHIDFAYFFDEVSLKEINSVQIPGNAAMQLADLFTKTFRME